MNINFSVKDLKVSVPKPGVEVEVSEISYALTDVKGSDLVTATKATIELIKEMNQIDSVKSFDVDTNFSFGNQPFKPFTNEQEDKEEIAEF